MDRRGSCAVQARLGRRVSVSLPLVDRPWITSQAPSPLICFPSVCRPLPLLLLPNPSAACALLAPTPAPAPSRRTRATTPCQAPAEPAPSCVLSFLMRNRLSPWRTRPSSADDLARRPVPCSVYEMHLRGRSISAGGLSSRRRLARGLPYPAMREDSPGLGGFRI
jgi:hypothetical protein